MNVIIPKTTILERHLIENELAEVEQLRADIDYVAMMSGIEIHDDEVAADE